jgi:type II restriction enzyme
MLNTGEINLMPKIKQAQKILKDLGLPKSQQNDMSALTLLALCGIKPKDKWKNASRNSLTVTKGIMDFTKDNYKKEYAPNTRETFRRQVLHYFVQARIVDYNPDSPNLPTNSPKAHYAITEKVLEIIKQFGTKNWKIEVKTFLLDKGSLIEKFNKKRNLNKVPVKLADGRIFTLSPGKHNILQSGIIMDLAPRFLPNSKLLYLGDTAQKELLLEKDELKKFGIIINDHTKLPDIIFYSLDKKCLILIEAVTSHGPMNPKRVEELEELFLNCKVGKIFFTAFLTFSEFKKHISEIAWETEVWIAEAPDHLIHFNGDKFLKPI